MSHETVPLLQLMQTKGIGPRGLARLLDRIQEERLSLQEFIALDAAEMASQFDMNEEQTTSIHSNRDAAEQTAARLEQLGVRTLLRNQCAYPSRLKETLADKAPPVLFVAGSVGLLERDAIGFCGARDASEEGIRRAAAATHTLAKQGLLVVSGHAQGVDEAAHRGALEAGGTTALVLPEGILNFRPRPSLGELLTEDQFVVVSEFPPKMPWSVSNAMQRNRTICGLVRALVVVEAGESGGTWEAGLEALKLKVPVFVFDYAEPAASAKGNRLLINKGGKPLACEAGQAPDLRPLVAALSEEKLPTATPMLF